MISPITTSPMPRYTPERLREIIAQALPPGTIIPRHTADKHFYFVPATGQTYSSVTALFDTLRERSFEELGKKRAIEYVRSHFHEFTMENIDDHLVTAGLVHRNNFESAGHIGTYIHECRARYFEQWIATGYRPADVLAFIDPTRPDIRATSALLGLQDFCIKEQYIPIVTELPLYSDKLKLGGSLDDFGMIGGDLGETVMLDVKTSNALHDRYWLQVSTYDAMFQERTGIKPKHLMILKLDKENRSYKTEYIKSPGKHKATVRNLLKVRTGMETITTMRKPKVITL